MKVLVTGATGYIGEHFVRQAILQHHDIFAASRRRPNVAIEWIPFDLASTAEIHLPLDVKAVIHLAATTNSDFIDPDRELSAAALILKESQRIGARFVFVSSQTAREDAPTTYGKTKWKIERLVIAAGGWVIRPGLVYGGVERGLFGTLVSVVRALPVIPVFLPSPKVQPVHVDDFSEGMLRIVERDDIPPGVLCLASTEPVSFTRFMLVIASARVRRQRWRVPIPVMLIQLVGGVLGRRLRIRLGLERLNSLFELPLMDTANDLQRLGLSLRSLPSGMHPSGDDRRRRLICEGQALLTYVLKERPGISLLRRYVRAVEKLRGGFPLDLPVWALRLPITLALLDDQTFALSARGAEFAWRLDAATTLAEATTQGACRFLGLGRSSGALMSLISISFAVVAEVVWRVLRIASVSYLRRYMRGTGSQQ